MTRDEATQAILEAKRARGVSFADIAEALGRPKVWATAAVLGQHPLDAEQADKLVSLLALPDDVRGVLAEVPWRGSFRPDAPPTDPTVYRLYEVIQVYGPAIKELIHEEFGDGIMSAISFNAELEREPAEDGDRVKITLNGKFLPYKW
ncbi:MAG: cyanate lyase [Solirubrobacteraceae bacterium]|jgi:cyanate lyase|nr:cyanate lyase [Solirubrobacteraceae bacterium]